MERKKILFYGDTPTCATGFATVSRNILVGLFNTGKYDITIFGVNYWGDPSPPLTQMFNIYPAGMNNERDPYGREKFKAFASQMDYDILFFLQDSFTLEFIKDLIPRLKAQGKKFVSLCYYPCDSVIKPEWADAVCSTDFPVAYTVFAKEQTNRPDKNIRVIYHGVDPNVFYKLSESDTSNFRNSYFSKHSDKFIFGNVNRNQQRKDIPRFLRAVRKLKDDNYNILGYCHCATVDQGWNLPSVCDTLGLSIKDDVVFPVNFSPNQGYPIQIVNNIYNAVDAVVSTDSGEGFGFHMLEAMATKTPLIVPNNTVRPELINDDIAYLVNSGTDDNLWTILPNDNEVLRPLTDMYDLTNKMEHVVDNYGEAKEKAEAAYRFVENYLFWETSIVPQWVDLFDEAVAKLDGTGSIELKRSSIQV
jgi:glycosyltransferase involved in cell wall biosynthesis